MKWIALALVALAACKPPTPVPQPDADAAPLEAAPPKPGTTDCERACLSLEQAGCREGRDPYCPGVLSTLQAERLIMASDCPMDGGYGTAGCPVTCSWCAQCRTPAECAARCGSSCTP